MNQLNIKVAIIEDEKPAARRLSRMLNKLEIEPIVMLHSVEESINWFNTHEHPELIFLDIQLSDGLSFEIFESVDIKSAIIFTTAFDEYAIKAFKFNSIDYLLKPIDDDELAHAINQFKQIENNKLQNLQFDINQIKRLLINPIERRFKTRFTIKIGQRIKIISADDIVCFYSENKGTYIHTNNNRDYLADNTLETIENQVDSSKYFRVNRTFIVKLESIKDIVSYTNNRLQIKLQQFDKEPIIVSRDKVKSFKQWLS